MPDYTKVHKTGKRERERERETLGDRPGTPEGLVWDRYNIRII